MRMPVTPSCQFYPQNTLSFDSFQTSACKLHLRKTLNLFNCSSFVPDKKPFLCAIHHRSSSDFRPRKHPRKKFNILRKDNYGIGFPSEELSSEPGISSRSRVISSRSPWLDSWNASVKPNCWRRPQAVANYRNREDVSSSDAEQGTSTSSGGSTMERIVEKLKNFGYMDDVSEKNGNASVIEKGSVEDVFYVEEGLLPNTRGGFSKQFPSGDESVRFPWEKNDPNEARRSLDSRKHRNMAELTLPQSEISRLMNLSLRIKNKTRVGGAGVTQQVVETIHEKWKNCEVVRLKIEGPPALNMTRVDEILERKTGGLVIWRSGTSVSLYRGVAYEDPILKLKPRIYRRHETSQKSVSISKKTGHDSSDFSSSPNIDAAQVSMKPDDTKLETSSELRYEDEVDKLLDSLGPRYIDWPGDGPLPLDADLLP